MGAGERERLSFIELAHLTVALASPDSIGRAGRLGISLRVGVAALNPDSTGQTGQLGQAGSSHCPHPRQAELLLPQ